MMTENGQLRSVLSLAKGRRDEGFVNHPDQTEMSKQGDDGFRPEDSWKLQRGKDHLRDETIEAGMT